MSTDRPKPPANPACAREDRSSSSTQRLLLSTVLVGAVCATVLAIVGVCMVLSAVLSMVPIPVLVLAGAAIGLAVHAR